MSLVGEVVMMMIFISNYIRPKDLPPEGLSYLPKGTLV
jgi:hypothetical protein